MYFAKNYWKKKLNITYLSLRFKFILVIAICLLVSMIISIWYLENIQAKVFEQEARHRSDIVADFGEANQKYVHKNLRPAVEEYTQEFVLEAMSAPHMTRKMFEYFNKMQPDYLYRQPTLNPLNPVNMADEFERKIISRFQLNTNLKEIEGYKTFERQKQFCFYVAKPIQVKSSCLKCHGNPEIAPVNQVKRYGTNSGYHWKVGEIISALMIYVPTNDLLANQAALRNTLLITFACLSIVLISLIYISFDWLVNKRLGSMIGVMEEVSASPDSSIRLRDTSGDELGILACTFNRMANSVEIAYSNLEQKVIERTAELEQTLQKLKWTQVQMLQTEKMSSLGQLVAGVAHEINNPVSFIHGNLNHVEEYTDDLLKLVNLCQQSNIDVVELKEFSDEMDLEFIEEDLPKILNSMKVGTERIREIVLSLRTFSRMDEAELKLVDIHQGIDSALMILQHRLKEQSEYRSIEVIKEYNQLPVIECYAGQINQVFMNILTNAIDAIREKANNQPIQEKIDSFSNQIIISTFVIDNDSIEIAMADNGIGMTKEVQEQMFNPFFTTKPVGSGTGMGMSISYQIITERHNGKLLCESSPQQGTEFRIQIPIRHSQV